MAQARATLGSVLNVIGSTAGTIVSALDNINAGMEMLSSHVEFMRAEQTATLAARTEKMLQLISDDYSRQDVEHNLDVAKFCKKSKDHESLYIAASKKYNKLLGIKEETPVAP